MPSASTKPDNKTSSEVIDPIKQAILVVEKKVRNLEKRKGKLDVIRQREDAGESLNQDQKEAIGRYDGVIQNLELARELQKQFQGISLEAEKLQKKQAKRERIERQAVDVQRLGELLQLQNTLDTMGSETVRSHFQEGKHGAVVLTEENLDQLDELYKLISPARGGEISYKEQLNTAAEHLSCFLDGKEKEVIGTTYKALNELVEKINACSYWDNADKVEEEEAKEEEPEKETLEEEVQLQETAEEDPASKIPISLPTEVPHEMTQPEDHPIPQMPREPQELDTEPPTSTFPEEDSFFSTGDSMRDRPFQEIVSSVQGTFNFLQESQILDSPHMDPAVVAAQPMAPSITQPPTQQTESVLSQQTYASSGLLSSDSPMSQQALLQSTQPQQASHHTPDPLDAQHQSQAGQASQQPLVPSQTSQPPHTSSLVSHQASPLDTFTASQDYSQNLMSQTLASSAQHSFTDQTSSLAAMSSHPGMDQTVVDNTGISSSTTAEMPPAIPLPNQTTLGQSLTSTDQSGLPQDAQEKKTFTMNPNAAMFRSMYGQPGMNVPQSAAQLQSTGLGDDASKGFGPQTTSDYQPHGSFGTFGASGRSGPTNNNRGGQRGMNRGGRGMSNGFSQRGRGGGGPSYNNGRSGYGNNRGGNGGGRTGMRNGPPPRGGSNMRGGASNRGNDRFGRPSNQQGMAMQQAA